MPRDSAVIRYDERGNYRVTFYDREGQRSGKVGCYE
jgi:hypothetical protein